MVPPRGRGNDSKSKTHGRDALSGGSGAGRSRHSDCSGGGSRSKHGGSSSGCRSIDGGSKARVGATGRGTRRLRTLGRKLCPLRVFTIVGLEKENK